MPGKLIQTAVRILFWPRFRFLLSPGWLPK